MKWVTRWKSSGTMSRGIRSSSATRAQIAAACRWMGFGKWWKERSRPGRQTKQGSAPGIKWICQACEAAPVKLLTDAELEAFTWDFPVDWSDYGKIEAAHDALCDAGKLINKPLD